jgi:hypothetical protein
MGGLKTVPEKKADSITVKMFEGDREHFMEGEEEDAVALEGNELFKVFEITG